MPMIQEKEKQLIERFEKTCHEGTVVQLDDAFAALTADLIS